MHRYIKLIFLIGAALLTAQCGDKDSPAANVEFEIVPENPIIILADLTFTDANGNEVTISGPYFRFQVRVKNQNSEGGSADETIERTIALPAFKGTVFGRNGEKVGDVSWDSAEVNQTVFAEVAPGEETLITTVFFLSGLKIDEDGNNFRYRVELKPLGWFGTAIDARNRYRGKTVFYTQ